MSTTSRSSRKSQLVVFGPPNTPRPGAQKGNGSTSKRLIQMEAERDVLLQLVPDLVYRIKARQDGSILVKDGRSGAQVATDPGTAAAAAPEEDKARSLELTGTVGQELACRGRALMDAFLSTGAIQATEFTIEYGGHTSHYQVRTAACGPWELMAVVTDITARKEAEVSIGKALSEVARLNEVLQNEATQRAEDEQVLDNAFAKLGKLLEDTIAAIQKIVQMKDPPTAAHQARVCKLACAIGREMGLAKAQVDTIGLAALLHDLGKVFVADETLNKPGKLTESEYAAIKQSAETEFQILKTIDLFYPIADIVHQHHERLNGSGYPLGLKGEDILLEARVIGVADVVEAMVSDRPYRSALTLDEALAEIESGKGTLYDPSAVEACLRIFRENRFHFDRVEDDEPQEAAYSGT
ncbi:MAG: HD-GYP domain-containing protein [Dehalococcoidia bacterium]|nr:HD-GYP domain-containing protein [Dehalococcoidia bacterium]